MLTLINSNRMVPPIAPLGLDYVGASLRQAGIQSELLDLNLVDNPDDALHRCFAERQPELIGVSFRNIDDCFWPSGVSFLPELSHLVASLRELSDAPIVLGGVGYSIIASELLRSTGADFGIRGDGEQALVELVAEFRGPKRWDRIGGLLWKQDGAVRANSPAWPGTISVPTNREIVDNAAYFRLGGQIGVETKRGCNRKCSYCVDPLAKGPTIRLRAASEVADEMESLLRRGIDVFHLCDAEFNLPYSHARDVCNELIRRGIGSRCRWYAYLAVLPFDNDLAQRMARAGCVGINFTSDSANAAMLLTYGQLHRQEDLRAAIRHCREHGIAVMCDLLLGGPGETAETVTESIRFFQHAGPDCIGTALGLRLFPRTPIAAMVAEEGPMETNPSIRRHYQGAVDLLRPTFYISALLGERPAQLVHDLIAGDPRFFEPEEERPLEKKAAMSGDHNYNANQALSDAIRAGARGAYWDILRKHRSDGLTAAHG
jgi:tryptophan 2-C-methyltransferase